MPATKKKSIKKAKVAAASKAMTAAEAKDFAMDMEALAGASEFAEPSFKYRVHPMRKLWPDERMWTFLQNVASFRGRKSEAAALLGVTHSALSQFMDKHPEAKLAWARGLGTRKFNLRRMLINTAETDPATLRFLAKNELGMTDGNTSKTQVDVTVNSISDGDRLEKIKALQSKVIDVEAEDIEEVPAVRAIDTLIQRGIK